jgi:hypothetical protein
MYMNMSPLRPIIELATALEKHNDYTGLIKANFQSGRSGKLSVEWNGQENFSLSCGLWVGTNDFKTQKHFLVCSNARIIFLSGN